MLASRSRRRTRYASFARCAQPSSASQGLKRAHARRPTSTLRFSPTHKSPRPGTACRDAVLRRFDDATRAVRPARLWAGRPGREWPPPRSAAARGLPVARRRRDGEDCSSSSASGGREPDAGRARTRTAAALAWRASQGTWARRAQAPAVERPGLLARSLACSVSRRRAQRTLKVSNVPNSARHVFGNVTPRCPWYLPPRSLYEVSQTSSLSKKSTCAQPSPA